MTQADDGRDWPTQVEGKQSANPRTGAMVPFSVLKAIKNHTHALVVGA